jgi:hypothetical protein
MHSLMNAKDMFLRQNEVPEHILEVKIALLHFQST